MNGMGPLLDFFILVFAGFVTLFVEVEGWMMEWSWEREVR